MAKQFILSALEETFGEYIANVSKEHLKIAALRGQLSLENVQLDGDLVGSHVLGAFGLSSGSLGVLSCSAKCMKVHIPWKHLEQEPTRLEISGVHLVCVPLTPATAQQSYGAGTKRDPRCTLRTRAKRIRLARLERNFWNGLLPGEGPVMKKIQRAVREVERDRKRNKTHQRNDTDSSTIAATTNKSTIDKTEDMDEWIDSLVHTLGDNQSTTTSQRSNDTETASATSISAPSDDLPELPRDWKVKLREKVLRNIEAVFADLHIRLEVPPDNSSPPTPAFALGFTLDRLVIRTANSQWQVGRHDPRTSPTSDQTNHPHPHHAPQDHLGPNEYVAFNNKIGFFHQLSIYWDDDPPILLSEIGTESVVAAMDALFRNQEPGSVIRQSLSASNKTPVSMDVVSEGPSIPHCYICEGLEAEVRVRTSDRVMPGPISCSADVQPFHFTFHVRPSQYLQFQKLMAGVKAQQRFDTMPRQRPAESPFENPSAWWKYAIACVTSRPHARPWEDVKRIGQSRLRYIQLVMKKNADRSSGAGYHGGLTAKQSEELLAMEDSLPMEALLALHLVALRRVYTAQITTRAPRSSLEGGGRRFRIRRPSSKGRLPPTSPSASCDASMAMASTSSSLPPNLSDSAATVTSSSQMSLLEAMTLRLGKKVWFIDWKLRDAAMTMIFRRACADAPLLQFVLRASGNLKSFGIGKRDFRFIVSQCDITHGSQKVLFFGSGESFVFSEEDESQEENGDSIIDFAEPIECESMRQAVASLSLRETLALRGPDLITPSQYLELPPPGTACRIVAGKDHDTFKISVSAHPATLVWTNVLSDSVLETFSEHSSDLYGNLKQHIRNFATPMARKAQLALLSPGSLSLNLNIASPKVWIPIISGDSEGCLLLDAGTLRMKSSKDEGETEAQWNILARDIGAKFVRGLSMSRFNNDSFPSLPAFSAFPMSQGESVVVRPFSIDAKSCILRGAVPIDAVFLADPIRNVEVTVSPICLNLVDSEMIARLLGKLYARGLHKVRRESPIKDQAAGIAPPVEPDLRLAFQDIKWSELPRIFTVFVEKIEIALEGHSKQVFTSDDRSMASLDSALQEYAPPTRAYLVEIHQVTWKKSGLRHTEMTRFMIIDASIVRLRDVSLYNPLSVRRELIESENRILVRASDEAVVAPDGMDVACTSIPDNGPFADFGPQQGIFRASLLHNRLAHLDEVEVDIDSVILRITPTTLKDCAKAFRRIMELTQLVTKEMERKVHEEGRKARRRTVRDADGSQVGSFVASQLERPGSPTFSDAMTDFSILEINDSSDGFDSSIHFRVTLKKSTLLVGRPTSLSLMPSPRSQRLSFAVVQVVSNTLLMFQSIENPDATGTKTLHISIDNVSALVNTEFECVSPTHAPLILEPTGAEFRIVYSTENFGCIVSQDISFNYDTIKSCLTTNDASIVVNVIRTMIERLRSFGAPVERPETKVPASGFSSFLRYQKRGTGVATRIRFEVHSFSFVLLRAYKSFFGAPAFLDFNVKHLKGLLDGCISALSGELSCVLAIVSFNSNVLDWEYAVEPCSVNMSFEQMPNEFVLNVSPSALQLNLTGVLLRDFSEMIFDIGRSRPRRDSVGITQLEPSVLSTIGLRRASEARSIAIRNLTGLDIQIVPSSVAFTPETAIFESNTKKTLDTASVGVMVTDDFKLSMRLAPSASTIVGDRQPIYSIPVVSLGINARLFLLRPSTPLSVAQPGRAEVLRLLNGRSSPESLLSESPAYDTMFYSAEPVVECCMQNQRLRPSVVDLYSLPKGHDLLSSLLWSPEELRDDDLLLDSGQVDSNGPEAAAGTCRDIPATFDRPAVALPVSGLAKGNWLRPYLKNDSPEWSDMTCMLSIARERVLLPDSRWIWLNDWTVDVNGRFGEETDADGWSYEADFETFTYVKRHYARGDACRRRKWTRTRMVQPPRFDDPLRHLQVVWETAKDENGCFSITVRSPVVVRNFTSTTLSFFVFSPSWNEDVLIGTATAGAEVCVPVIYASAVFMRIAVSKHSIARDAASLSDFAHSERFLMVPTSHTSSKFVRTQVHFEDVSGTILHYLVEIRSEKGIVSVVVEPVFRVVNMLPCQLECQVGHLPSKVQDKFGASPKRSSPKQVTKTDAFIIQSGKDECCTAVNPWRKPHISLRVPGYKWSSWKKIVNRKTDSTWRPSEPEEEFHFTAKGDSEYSEENMTLVRFERLSKFGDPLTLILSVACGHCPTIRVFSQYWIVDKTGFGCHFSEGFTDILGNSPDPVTSRRSYFLKEETKHPEISADLVIPGHQWSIGIGGMSLYFSQREKLTLSLETGIDSSSAGLGARSKWISPLDISNVIPKTVFSVDELNGTRRFELAIHVTLCPGQFRRTKMITLLPRYLIVNLLHRELVVAQDGCLDTETVIPSQSSISFHWEKGSLPPKIRLGAPSAEERARDQYERCWTNGRFQLDRVGITSLRLPTTNTLVKLPMVVQAEVRLATKDQSSAVVIVVWSGSEKSNPLYTLRNRTRHVILCRQPLQDDNAGFSGPDGGSNHFEACTGKRIGSSVFECGADLGPLIRSFLGLDRIEEFVWILKPGDVTCFGFDDPEKPHIIEWTYVTDKKSHFTKKLKRAFLEVDAMGSYSVLALQGGAHVRCQIKAEHSTKVIEFSEIGTNGRPVEPLVGIQGKDVLRQHTLQLHELLRSELSAGGENQDSTPDDEDTVAFSLKIDFPLLSISVVDNLDPTVYGREILLAQIENLYVAFSQTSEGYHNFEARLMTLQIDNHIRNSIHPVMIFFPRIDDREPLLHISAVRRLQPNSNTFVFRYAAIRLLEVEIFLDRRTAETFAKFIQPLLTLQEQTREESPEWITTLTSVMAQTFAKANRRCPRNLEQMALSANAGRIYFEQLHLHPVRLGLTFTQEWMDSSGGSDNVMVFQFIRGMASIANAPLVFTSFVVGHVFESPQALFRVVTTHYSSQLTKQVFGILGSLAILGAPADFISNVGNGVKDFLYEPLQGAVIGPKEFLEGLEVGTQSLARGVFVGVVRGAANVTDAVNSNLAGLTADDNFIDERKAHQRILTDAMSRGVANRTFRESLNLAYASVARGLKSGALGIIEQPAMYASKHGPIGFLKGIGKAIIGAVVKPVVGLGDGAVLVMNHVSDATSKKQLFPKIPKRLRRAMPSRSTGNANAVYLEPYDERAARAQSIVTGGENTDDVYLGHVNIASHLVIASERCLWAIDRRSRDPWCVSWEEISHFSMVEGGIQIVVFSQTGLKAFLFQVENTTVLANFHQLLATQHRKMANASELNSALSISSEADSLSSLRIPGVRSPQVNYVFGTYNNSRKRIGTSVSDEVDLVEQCYNRVRNMDSSSSTFFKTLDGEAWSLISHWGQLFTGLSSRRCIVASIINGTGYPIQIKSSRLVEGGSPCYSLATREYDTEQGVLHAGGAILFFGWGAVPNLLQAGNVLMQLETNGFVSHLADHKGHLTDATPMPGFQVGFLEKSYDDAGWWAKYWLLVRNDMPEESYF